MGMNGSRVGPAMLATNKISGTGTVGFGQPAIGALKGINLGGGQVPTSYLSDGTFGRVLQAGVNENTSDGNPAQPSLSLDTPGFWRFRWSVRTGSRYIQVNVKQVGNGSARPSLVVKANPGILATDQTVTASSSTGWVVISVSFTALADGRLWVELWNNDYSLRNNPALFDHLVAT